MKTIEPKIVVPKDISKIKQQIRALEYQLKHDINEKDRKIHQEALDNLKTKLNV